MLAECGGDAVGVAGRADDRVAGGECRAGDVDAHAAPCASDEPDLLVSHVGCPSVVCVSLSTSTQPPGAAGWESRLKGAPAGHPTRPGPPVAWGVDNRAEIREFLMSRRAKITPAQAGLPPAGRRRVPGLRRIEVAMLAGVSVEYYSRLERGDAAGVSESILDAIAGALQLDDAERRHLLDLVRTSGATRAPRRRTPVPRIRPTVQYVLDAITAAPAIVHDGRLNHLGGNALGKALFSPFFATGDEQPNSARYTFLDPRAPSSSATGTRQPTTPSPSCAPKPAATPTTATCPTSSASSPPAARSSGPAGPPTTSASTPPAPNDSTTPWSATSTCPTSRSRRPTMARTSSSTSPNPTAPPTTHSTCSPATRPPTRSRPGPSLTPSQEHSTDRSD